MINPEKDWLDGWLIIVNKNAGNRRGGKDWPKIQYLLSNAGFNYQTCFTNEKGNAVQIVKTHLKDGVGKFIIVGGDGTVNETVNGIFAEGKDNDKEAVLGLIPVGTGNDWGRMYSIPKRHEESVGLIRTGRIFQQDIAFVKFREAGNVITRYFANNAGIGYDARVAKETNTLKESGNAGTLAYLYTLVSGLLKYKYQKIRVEIDGKVAFEGPFFTLTLGVCCYNGGGMKQLPYAIPDDGKLDVTVIHAVRKDIIIRNLHKVYSGSHAKLPIVDTYRGSEVKLRGIDTEIPELETDGESFGEGPYSFGILPKALKIVVNSDWQKKQ